MSTEPTFILRASDPYAAAALRAYAQYRENAEDGLYAAAQARQLAREMVEWAMAPKPEPPPPPPIKAEEFKSKEPKNAKTQIR